MQGLKESRLSLISSGQQYYKRTNFICDMVGCLREGGFAVECHELSIVYLVK